MNLTIISAYIVSFIFVCYSIKKSIYISNTKHLFDEPSEDRKVHVFKTPNLGGAAIFASLAFTSSLFLSGVGLMHNFNYFICAIVILFLTGLTDDLVGMNPYKKFGAQLIVALIIAIPADIRLTDLYGILGIHIIPYSVSVFISVLFILFLINAFNLIDGINCLAGGIGLLVFLAFAFLFWKTDLPALLILSITMAGSLTGFLLYNKTPAKIFMGDSGSLIIGFMVAVFSIYFLEMNKPGQGTATASFSASAPAIILSLLIVPICDTLRVFTLRILKKKSPFSADRNHIHHRLIELNLTHLGATGILVIVNILTILLTFLLIGHAVEIIILAIIAFAVALNGILWLLTLKREAISFRQKIKTFEVSELSSL